MRSLYVSDILGAQPKKHVYNKRVFMERHEDNVKGPKNPEKLWYSPPKRPTQPLDRTDDNSFVTKRTLRKSFAFGKEDLSQSMALPRSSSLNNVDPKMQQSSILTGSARNSLNASNFSKIEGENPYFPHRYIDTKLGQSNRWCGSRQWNDMPTDFINLGSVKKSYFQKWN